MSIFSDILDIPLRASFSFSGNKEQHQTFEEFRKAQKEKPKNLILIKAKDRPFPIRHDDVLIRLKGVPRYYPEDDNYSKSSKTENETEEPFTTIKHDIKIVGKIEPVELDLLKQKETQIKLSNEQAKEQAKAAKKQAEELAKIAKSKAREKVKAAKLLAKEQEKAARKLEREKAKAAKKEKKQAEKLLQNPQQNVSPKTKSKKKSKKGKAIVVKVQAHEDVPSGNTIIIDDEVVETVVEQNPSVEPDLYVSQEIPEKKSKKKPTTFQSFIKKFKNERKVELEYPLKVAPVRPDDAKYRVDDVLVKISHVRRFYPKDYDKTKQPINAEQLDDAGSVLMPDIKIVDKIELGVLNERTRPKKKSKKQLERDRKEHTFQSSRRTKKQLAQEISKE